MKSSGIPKIGISSILLLALLCAAPAFAQRATPDAHPAWEQLSAAERDLLTAPIRERWNSNPGERARMLEHAQRWQAMTPEQRKRAHHGMKRWSHMDPGIGLRETQGTRRSKVAGGRRSRFLVQASFQRVL